MQSVQQIMPMQYRQRSLIAQFKRQLILSVGLLIFCLLMSSAAGVFVAFNQEQLGGQKVTLHSDIGTLLQAMVDQETGLRGYIATDNSIFLAPLNSGRVQYSVSLQKLKNETSSADFRATAMTLNNVENRVAAWETTYVELELANMRSGNLKLARADSINTQGKNLFDNLRRSISQLQQISDNDLATLQVQANIIHFSLIGGIFLLTLLVVIWLWRTFSAFSSAQFGQLTNLKVVTATFGAGNLAARVQEGPDSDFNSLGQTFNTMAAQIQEQQRALKDRDIFEQASQLNALLTESLNLDELMQGFFQRIFQLLDLHVGALYRYNPQNQLLELFAARGMRLESLQTSFTLGEGLIGRVAQERQALMIGNRELSTDTFQVKTVMGNVIPASLYHLPLYQGKELLGVLVVGSIYPMNEHSLNVVSIVTSNLAAALRNVQAYEHIQHQAVELAERSRQQEQSNRALLQQRDELTVLNSALEEANRVRSQFLSTMSHELRTPLTSIIGFSQILLRPSAKTQLNSRQTDNIERILKNAQHLLILINDVLDLAKIEAGRMDVDATEINLHELLNSVVEETRSIAIERNLALTLDVEDGIATLETDVRKVRQIVLNLISNALKFTEEGGVTVRAVRHMHTRADEEAIEQVVISVQDTGIGISPEMQEHIFDAFYQVDNSNSRNYGGTGLGLSIVRELTTLLGGKIEFQSEMGRGSTFSITLPTRVREQRYIQDLRLNTFDGQATETFLHHNGKLQAALKATFNDDEQEPDSETEPYLVVAIDDNPDVLQMIAASLEQSPYRVVGVQDSTQALAVVQELHPQAITLDIMMPRVNGWQILHQLKSRPETASIPVILLTVLEDRSAGYVLGADEYLAKPVERDALLNVLRQLTARSARDLARHQGDQTQLEDQPVDRIRPIWLVHNESDIHRFIERLMRETGHYIQNVSGDQELLATIKDTHPDLLMMFMRYAASNVDSTVNEAMASTPDGKETPTFGDTG